jgi:hypothetical protein
MNHKRASVTLQFCEQRVILHLSAPDSTTRIRGPGFDGTMLTMTQTVMCQRSVLRCKTSGCLGFVLARPMDGHVLNLACPKCGEIHAYSETDLTTENIPLNLIVELCPEYPILPTP